MTNEEQNSAEQEAEQILEGAYAEARAEECPQGTECPVHFRVNEEYIEEDSQYARLIDYVGEFAVITEDNYKLESPLLRLQLMLGVITKKALPPRYETTIVYVGSGTIGDIGDLVGQERKDRFRYRTEHDEWAHVKGMHEVAVIALEQGMIDVSKPLED